MAEVKWIKLKVDMFDDEKIKIIQSMPEGDSLLLVWIRLITLAGKTNDGGYIYITDTMPYTDEMLAVVFNKPLNTIRLALDTFTKLGMLENDQKGIYLVNFEKYQSLDKMEKIKEQNRLRKQKQRDKEKKLLLPESENVTSHVTVTQSHAIDIDKDIDKEIDKDKENKKEIIKEKKYFSDNRINSIFIEFLEVRKKLKAINSDRAINTLVNKLNKYNDNIKYQMLENSIVNSWKDVYEVKKDRSTSSRTRKEVVPDWLNKDIKREEASAEELKEIEDAFAEFKNEDWRKEAERLQKELNEKYEPNKQA